MNGLSRHFLSPEKALLFFLCIILSGCGMPRPETSPADDQRAMALVEKLDRQNSDILSSKGKGSLLIRSKGKRFRYKAAWAAQYPNRVRMTFLSSGIPVETVISDGKRVTFISHTGRHNTYIMADPDPDLKPVLEIPIRLSQVIRLLLGRPPLKPFNDAYFIPQPDSAAPQAVLRNSQTGQAQIVETGTDGRLKAIRQLNYSGKPVLSVLVLDYRQFEKKQIPALINVTATLEESMDLEIDYFIENPSLKEHLFQLTETGS